MQFYSAADLQEAVGKHLGYSDWLVVDQTKINDFADTTLDHQWIHTDVGRAQTESPYGAPVAHGLYGLSLIPHLTETLLDVKNIDLGINYGFNKVRFPAPIVVNSSIRAGATLAGVEETAAGQRVILEVVVEIEGQEKPATVAEWILLLRFTEV